MNPPELVQIAKKIRLESDECFPLRINFGIACIERVEHLLVDKEIIETLAVAKAFIPMQARL